LFDRRDCSSGEGLLAGLFELVLDLEDLLVLEGDGAGELLEAVLQLPLLAVALVDLHLEVARLALLLRDHVPQDADLPLPLGDEPLQLLECATTSTHAFHVRRTTSHARLACQQYKKRNARGAVNVRRGRR
jgi:hypothetical protein